MNLVLILHQHSLELTAQKWIFLQHGQQKLSVHVTMANIKTYLKQDAKSLVNGIHHLLNHVIQFLEDDIISYSL